VGGVVVDGGELLEGQRVAAGGQLAPGFGCPSGRAAGVAGGEIAASGESTMMSRSSQVTPGAAGRWRLRWMISSSS
jgi:hypothetical protein